MGLSFKEASAWVTAIVVTLVFGHFFAAALADPPASGLLLVQAVIATLIWEVLLHIVLAVRKAPEPVQDRDRCIAAKAREISMAIFCAGLAITVGQAIFPIWPNRIPGVTDIPPRMLLLDLAVLATVLAELAKAITQIVLYRRFAGRSSQL